MIDFKKLKKNQIIYVVPDFTGHYEIESIIFLSNVSVKIDGKIKKFGIFYKNNSVVSINHCNRDACFLTYEEAKAFLCEKLREKYKQLSHMAI